MSFFNDFAEALLEPNRPAPKGMISPGGRFDVYRNNVTASLAGVLAKTFPVVLRMLGEEYFGALAVSFVRSHPPNVRMVSEYGADFPDFIETFEQLREFAYLGDVARLEWARLAALHAADAPRLNTALAEDPRALLDSRLQFHSSVRLVCSAFPIADLWTAHQNENVESPTVWIGQNVLISRFEDRLLHLVLSAREAEFLSHLPRAEVLGDALFALGTEQEAADRMGLCLDLVHSGCLVPDHP